MLTLHQLCVHQPGDNTEAHIIGTTLDRDYHPAFVELQIIQVERIVLTKSTAHASVSIVDL